MGRPGGGLGLAGFPFGEGYEVALFAETSGHNAEAAVWLTDVPAIQDGRYLHLHLLRAYSVFEFDIERIKVRFATLDLLPLTCAELQFFSVLLLLAKQDKAPHSLFRASLPE